MKRGVLVVMSALISGVLFSEITVADIVHLKNGNTLHGDVESNVGGEVIVNIPGTGKLTLKDSEIASIEKSSEEAEEIGEKPVKQRPLKQAASSTERENIRFKKPESWGNFRLDEKAGMYSFETSNDPTKKLIGYVKSFEVPDQTALQWAIDEAKSLGPEGIQIVTQPKEIHAGDTTWVMLAWEASMPSQGRMVLFEGEQYYLKGNKMMVEVFLSAPKDVYSKANRQEIEQFLTSIRFVKSSVSSTQDGGELEEVFNQGRTYLRQSQYAEAIRSFERCLQLLPENDRHLDAIYDNLGIAYMQQKDTEKAVMYFKKSIAVNPAYALSRIHLGAAYRLKDDVLSALPSLIAAMQIEPDNPLVHDELWRSYASLGRRYGYDKTLMLREAYHIEKLLEIFPQYANREPLAPQKLGYLTMSLANEIEKASQHASRARVFPQGLSDMSKSEMQEFVGGLDKELTLPNDNISDQEKTAYFEKATGRFKR